jgi:hypothetical protein
MNFVHFGGKKNYCVNLSSWDFVDYFAYRHENPEVPTLLIEKELERILDMLNGA